MSTIYSPSFKNRAVEKALNRAPGITLNSIIDEFGISRSTLTKWVRDARNTNLGNPRSGGDMSPGQHNNEKRPQDWSLEERFEIVMACESLDDEQKSAYCRKQGIYPHHVSQWKLEFTRADSSNGDVTTRQELKHLKHENKALKKELNRKDRALAETAALLVLQKKVKALLGADEDDLQ